MRIKAKYLDRLAEYGRWSLCRTPLQRFATFLRPFWEGHDEPLFATQKAAECLWAYESLGVDWPCEQGFEEHTLNALWNGKGVRDWWMREIEEWFRLGLGEPLFNVAEFAGCFPNRRCYAQIREVFEGRRVRERRQE